MPQSRATIYDPNRRRDDPSPARHDEPTSEFYERCSNPVIGSVRDNLERWYAEYPGGTSRSDLYGRLRDPDRRQWNSAVWELYIHEALRRMGVRPEPHPRMPDTARRIDFVTTTGEPVYVECVTVAHSDQEAARRGGKAKLEAAVDEIGVFDYWLDLQVDPRGRGQIPAEQFVRELRAWLLDQDIDVLASLAHRGHAELPAYTWDVDGSRAHVWAIPRSPELRGRTDIRPLAITSIHDEGKEVWLALRGQMELKAYAYGDLDAPYVIAVNAPDAWEINRQAVWAVFGPHPFTDAWERDGFFLRDEGPTHANVSGVLVATALQPHSFTRQEPTLYENPAAKRPIPTSVRWDRVRVVDGHPLSVPGVKATDLFGLPAEWPGVPWPG